MTKPVLRYRTKSLEGYYNFNEFINQVQDFAGKWGVDVGEVTIGSDGGDEWSAIDLSCRSPTTPEEIKIEEQGKIAAAQARHNLYEQLKKEFG